LLNTACTEVSFAMFTTHVGAVPEQAPDQLTNCLPAGGVAVSVTAVPSVNFAEQFPGQSMALSLPAGVPVTVPELLRPIERVNCDLKDAVAVICPLTVTEQVN